MQTVEEEEALWKPYLEPARRLHAVFCKEQDGKPCDIPFAEHPFPEWWMYVAYYAHTGDNGNVFVRFREAF